MIEALLQDAADAGAIRAWRREDRMLHPRTYVVVLNDGSAERRTVEGISDFCVGLAIGSGMIPNPHE